MLNFLSSLRTLALAFILSIGISYTYAAWAPPSTTPTGGNAEAPINTGSATQLKSGGLGVNGLLHAYSNAIFDGNVGIGVTNPVQKVDVQGGVKVATVSSGCAPSIAGTIMYDGKFKGCDGSSAMDHRGLI